MNLSPERKISLLKLAAGTVGVLLAMWLLVINPARGQVEKKIKTENDLTQQIFVKQKVIQTADMVATKRRDSLAQLEAVEDRMVSGDPYLWIIKTLQEFEAVNKVEFSKYDPPRPGDVLLPSRGPYKTVSFTVTGAANYHNLGKFLASLENSYPHISVHRLDLEPVPGVDKSDEKLSFLLELYVLVKPVRGVAEAKPSRP